jgi:hypothetical protein
MAIVFPNNTMQELSAGRVYTPGNIIQIVDVPFTASLSTNNWATQNTIATATITPTSTSSQILIYTHIHLRSDVAQGNWSLGYYWIYHDNTGALLHTSSWAGTWRHTISSWQKNHLHSPSSTSAQTYSLRCGNHPAGLVHHNASNQNAHDGLSYIRLTEFRP